MTGTGFATHDFSWIERHIPDGADARLLDVTSAFAVLPLMGPRARDLLQQLTADDVSNDGFPSAMSGRSGSPARRCGRCA